MLYDNKSCSNSYYWENMQLASTLLIVIPLLIFIIYGLYLILKKQSKKSVKSEFIPILISIAMYLSGVFLLLNKDAGQIFGLILISISSICIAYLRKNIAYLLLSFIVLFLANKEFKPLFTWFNIILLIGLTYVNLKKLTKKEKKLTYIILGILLALFIIGIILLIYVSSNKPDVYCWGS